MVACDPAWMRRRPDQRQRSSLGKTLGLRMDGISVRKPFPLGSLVLEPRDQVTTQKHRHERGGDANPHTWGSLSVLQLHSTTNNVSLRPLCSLPSKIATAQYLWVTAKPHQFNLPIHPPGLLYTTTSPCFNTPKTLKLHHRGLTGNPDTPFCWGDRGGLGWFATPRGSFLSTGVPDPVREGDVRTSCLSILTNINDMHTQELPQLQAV